MAATATNESAALQVFWEAQRRWVDADLDRWLQPQSDDSARLFAAMRHAVTAGGKRLRPILAIAAFSSLGGDGEGIYAVGSALELLHTYSLIHDDLPCMDDDDLRRGKPTVHIAFDEGTAVLAGDALHALAFEILARCAARPIIEIIAHAVGPSQMVGGQMADLEAEGKIPTESLVAGIHRRKTGALITASVVAGGMMADTSGAVKEQLEAYAAPLGLAFQIVDDLLELTQSSAALGKPVGSDLKHEKVTYPGAVGIDASRRRAHELIAQSKAALSTYSGDSALLRALADFVIARDR